MTQFEGVLRGYDSIPAPAKASPEARRMAWSRPTTIINMMLVAALVAAGALYVYFANIAAAGQYGNKLLQSRAATVAEANGILEARQTTSGDTMNLLEFAQRHAMIPAADATHVYETSGVALNR